MSTPHALLARRLTAGLALVALPLGAAVGCGAAAESKRDDVQTSLQKASDNLKASGSMSVTMRFDDGSGSIKKATTSGEDALTPDQADLLLGGTISMTVDPAAGKTLGDVAAADRSLPPAEQLKLTNFSVSVQADGDPLAQLRVVSGDLYANVSLDALSDVAKRGGSTTDLGAQVDDLAASAPAELQPLVTDVRAGKWIKLPLAAYADQLAQLQKTVPTPSASVDPQKLSADLLAAVKPFVAVTDASSDGGDRVLDVKVQAKQAIKAALETLKSMGPALPGLDTLDTTGVDKIGDGTVNGQVTLSDDHLTKLTVDLQSAVALAPPGATPAPDLTGGTLTVDVDDSADEVTVPDDVSSVDVDALVKGLVGSLGGSLPS